jgi:hypothetical protein
MGKVILESGKMDLLMGMECINGSMEINMKVNSSKISKMDMAKKSLQMATLMWVII